METLDASGTKNQPQPYRRLRDDPRYAEIKKIIDQCPKDKMGKLRSYINRWLRTS
jgi:hypothetical protein